MSTGTEVITYSPENRDYAPVLTADHLKNQVNTIQHVMKAVMKQDEHYGVIPGCGDKPTLLQPGAQKLALTFGFAPTYTIDERQLPGGHREYRVTCRLSHRQSGGLVGEGVGCCSTMEKKYRYRSESTGRAVPSEYWNNRDTSLLGGRQYSPRKSGDGWVIYEQIDHDNPADNYNTCLKMAKKRAFVDATLTACAASDIFTQDIEDETTTTDRTPQGSTKTPPKEVRRAVAPAPGTETGQGGIYITNVEEFNGESNGKPWTKFTVEFSDGVKASTFDATLAALAEECQNQIKMVDPELQQKGKYTNLIGLSIVEAPKASNEPVPNPVETTILDVETKNNNSGGVNYVATTEVGRFGTSDAELGGQLMKLNKTRVNLTWEACPQGMKALKVLSLDDIPF